jgi:uncharacterized phage protein gp47/JayE
MSFQRPSLATLRADMQAAVVAEFSAASVLVRRALAWVLARIVAGGLHLTYGYLDWVAKQLFLDTAVAEYLDRQAREYGLARKAPVAATGNVTLTGISGTTLFAGAVLVRSDGATYTTAADATLSAGTATVAVTAELDITATTGAYTNALAGVALTLQLAVPGIAGTATVASGGLTGGADAEDDESLRARVLLRKRSPPQGGSKADYVAWALAQPGVTRAWCYPLNRGAGTVDVAFVMDQRDDIIPASGDVAAVQAAIDVLRPVGMAEDGFQAFAPVGEVQNFTIHQVAVIPAAVRAAMVVAWNQQLLRDCEPGGTMYLSNQVAALTGAASGYAFDLYTPSADVTFANGHIATPGTGTWS